MLYRVLIVDDERTIAEAVHALLAQLTAYELDIYHRTATADALSLVRRHRFDLVITDIEMPGMNGLALAELIGGLWPECKLIFLSGYQDYEYMRRAVQLASFDYVLKANGLRALMQSVQRALAALDGETALRAASLSAENQWPQHQAEMAQACLADWYLRQQAPDPALLAAHFPGLLPERPVWILLVSIEGEPASAYALALSRARIAGQLALTMPGLGLYPLPPEARTQCLLLQAGGGETDPLFPGLLREALDTLAQLLQTALDTRVHFVLSSEAVPREAVGEMRDQLLASAMLHLEDASVYAPPMPSPDQGARFEQTYWTGIEYSLMEGDYPLFASSLEKLYAAYQGQPDAARRRLLAFHTLSRMLVDFTRRLDAPFGAAAASFDALAASGGEAEGAGPPKAILETARVLFAMCTDARSRRKEHNVQIVTAHIHSHLADDLSLMVLSEVVHLNPSYFSRLFRAVTGRSLSDYVLAARLEKAQQLLAGTALQVQEIATTVGFDNASYFTTVFRRSTGLTPLDFRREKRQEGGILP